MASSPERGPDWGNLLPEILALVAKTLAPLDYLNFTAVCKSWGSIAPPGYGMPPPLPLRKPHPFLLMRGDDGEQSDSIALLDVFDNPRRSYKIGQLPEIEGKWFAGSQFGWIAVVDELSTPSLLNPFTRAHVDLPPITTLPDVTPVYDSHGSISGYFHIEEESYSLEEFRLAYPFRKLVLSSDPTDGSFTAAAIFSLYNLMFVRPGEKTWTYWNRHIGDPLIDVVYREGEFLALTAPGDVYAIHPFDLSAEPRIVFNVDQSYSNLRYLIEDPSGDLLHVSRDYEVLEVEELDTTTERTNVIEVRRLDPETGAWVPMPSLGDRALFIGSSCAMSLPAGNGVRGNCVYFTDNNWDMFVDETLNFDRDMGVFDMSNMSFEVLYPPKPLFNWPPPIWIASPLL